MHDQVRTFNYCAHVIEDLRRTASMLERLAPDAAWVLRRLIAMLRSSLKFIVPNCCSLLKPDALRQAHLDLVRLPFACVAFEAPWEKGEAGPVRIGEFEQSSATRRIVLPVGLQTWLTSVAFRLRPALSQPA